MECIHDKEACELGEVFKIIIATSDGWCEARCKPNSPVSQLAMLKRFGINLPQPPKDKDLLEWAKECIANGTVKLTPRAEQAQKQKAEHAKVMAELPSRFQQAKTLHKHAKQILEYRQATGRMLVCPEWKVDRLAECDDCDKLWLQPKSGNKRCSTCGCNVVGLVGDKYGKADFEALECDKWDKVDVKYK